MKTSPKFGPVIPGVRELWYVHVNIVIIFIDTTKCSFILCNGIHDTLYIILCEPRVLFYCHLGYIRYPGGDNRKKHAVHGFT